MKKLLSRLPVLAIVVLVVVGLTYGFWPARVRVDIVTATRGDLQVTVDDDGRTRIREKYIVSAPVTGKLLRLESEEGDAVVQGVTVLARIEPADPSLLDARAQAEAEARVRSADAARKQAEASRVRAVEAHKLASFDYKRAQGLLQSRAMSTAKFQEIEHREHMADADVRSAEFAVAVANFEVELAKAALIRTRGQTPGTELAPTLTIVAPVNGRILRIIQKDAAVVSPGAQLVEIGDPHDLEMEIDVLSTDAVKIRPGAKVYVDHWGGPGVLEGAVRLVEPAAFQKISALGVEEQRVNVIADFTSPFEDRKTLGDAYRIEARIVVGESLGVVKAPTGVLLHENGKWLVYRVVEGRAQERVVEVGASNGVDVEILDGVNDGDQLILHPPDAVADGVRVESDP